MQLTLDSEGRCSAIGIGLTNVAEVPLKATRAESRLLNTGLQETDISEAAQMASDDARPSSDLRGSEAYKRAVIKVMTGRTIQAAAEHARKHQPGN